MLVTDAAGETFRCPSTASPCGHIVAPGITRISLEGIPGSGQIRLRAGETKTATGKIVTVQKLSTLELSGIVLIGTGLVTTALAHPIATSSDRNMESPDDVFYAIAGAGAGVALIGGLI